MNDFLIGLVIGAIVSRLSLKKKKENADAGVQADEVFLPPSQPIPIQNSKKSYIPSLVNFWGPDS